MKHFSFFIALIITACVLCNCNSSTNSQTVRGVGSDCLNKSSVNSDSSIQYASTPIDSILDDSGWLEHSYLGVANTQDNSYTFTYYFMENCCSKYDVHGIIKDNVIKIKVSVNTLEVCNCMCPYSAAITLDDLTDGVYVIETYVNSKKVGSTSVELKDGVNTLITL